MEELNLGDLEFDTSSMNLFDAETGKADNAQDAEPSTANKTTSENSDDLTDKETTDGDGAVNSDQESVANQDEENNQVQAGETTSNEGSSDSSSPKLNETEQLYSNLAAEFKAKGVLPELDVKNIKSLDDLNKAIDSKIESGLTDRQRLVEEAISSGAPVDEVVERANTIDKLMSITPDFIKDEQNIDFRRNAIMQDFLEKGYGEERAATLAQRSIDAGTDIEDAQFAVANLIKSEQAGLTRTIQVARQAEQDSLKDIKNYISSTPEVIPNISLTDSQKDELYNRITTDLGNKKNAMMMAQQIDPLATRIKLEALYFLTKDLTDFSVFGNTAETKITNNIENLLRGAKFTEEGTVDTNVPDKNSNFILSDLKDFEIDNE